MANNMRGGMRERKLHVPSMVLMAGDALAWVAGVLAAMALRFDFAFETWSRWDPVRAIAVVVATQIVAGVGFGLYRGRWRRGTGGAGHCDDAGDSGIALFDLERPEPDGLHRRALLWRHVDLRRGPTDLELERRASDQ